MSHKKSQVLWIALLAMSLAGCATSAAKKEDVDKEMEAMRKEIGELRAQLTAVNTKVDTVETKASSMNDKIDATKTSVDNLLTSQKIKAVSVNPHVNDTLGAPVDTGAADNDPEVGFINDKAVFTYRQARILFQAKKYPEAVLAYSGFVEKYPDHALAGAAQFHVGESYLKQNEYKLAIREYQRVLTTYDRSPYIADTLRQMAFAEDQLKMGDAAAKHRQMLLALFPQSPAAAEAKNSAHAPEAKAPATPEKAAEDKAEGAAAPSFKLDDVPPTAPAAPGDGAKH